jgi:hypothetical protein
MGQLAKELEKRGVTPERAEVFESVLMEIQPQAYEFVQYKREHEAGAERFHVSLYLKRTEPPENSETTQNPQ